MWWELVLLSPLVDDSVEEVTSALAVGEVEEPDDVTESLDDVEGAGALASLLNLFL